MKYDDLPTLLFTTLLFDLPNLVIRHVRAWVGCTLLFTLSAYIINANGGLHRNNRWIVITAFGTNA